MTDDQSNNESTVEIFRQDAYAATCEARVTAVDEDALYLDRTVFYPNGGGQPGDTGVLRTEDGLSVAITDTRKGDEAGSIKHHFDPESFEPSVARALIGKTVTAEIDWPRRHRMMRVHTLLHLLCAVIPAGVTGGAIRDDGSGRLDFDLPESTLDKVEITAALNEIVQGNHAVTPRWVDDSELDANPQLVRTMSVAPPRGQGRVRLLEIESVDLQPCGGTHVAATAEIGEVVVSKVEKKGKHNRRVTVKLV